MRDAAHGVCSRARGGCNQRLQRDEGAHARPERLRRSAGAALDGPRALAKAIEKRQRIRETICQRTQRPSRGRY